MRTELLRVPMILLSGAGALFLGQLGRAEAAAAVTYEDVYYLPSPPMLRVLALGHTEALADLLWCRALVNLGEEYGHQGSLRYVFDYTESMLALDPDFLAVYRWIGTAGVYQPVETDVADVERSVAIMERGRRRFPQDGRLAWLAGATLTFELPNLLPPERRVDARLRGTEHLMDAVRLGAAPEWMVLANTSILQQFGHQDRIIQHLEEMYATVSDERVREEIAVRIEDLRSASYREAFVQANDEAEAERLRTFPYVHPSLFFLLGTEEPAIRLSDGVFESALLDEE